MKNIKIYVSCHKPCFVPKHQLLYPIQVGTSIKGEEFENMLHDNKDENISKENGFYSELTAQYWAWKNQEADYYGFFHYRRYLSFKRLNKLCIFKSNPNSEFLEKYGYDVENMNEIISKYDIIVPKPINMYQTVRQQYINSKEHSDYELDRVFEIMYEIYPDMKNIGKSYLEFTEMYFCNMYIMKKEIFIEYCQWLFSILQKYDEVVGTERKARIDGYLSERLFGVYFLWLKEKKNIKYLELSRVDFEFNNKIITKNKCISFFLPEGTKRRAYIKKYLQI